MLAGIKPRIGNGTCIESAQCQGCELLFLRFLGSCEAENNTFRVQTWHFQPTALGNTSVLNKLVRTPEVLEMCVEVHTLAHRGNEQEIKLGVRKCVWSTYSIPNRCVLRAR